MQGTVSERCQLKVWLSLWVTSVHYYYLVQISGFWEQLGRNRNRIVKKTAGYPAIRNRISGTYISALEVSFNDMRYIISRFTHLLSVPRHNLSFGSRAFRISASKIWNSLPPHILQSQTLDSFRRHLKTYYFQPAYPAP